MQFTHIRVRVVMFWSPGSDHDDDDEDVLVNERISEGGRKEEGEILVPHSNNTITTSSSLPA